MNGDRLPWFRCFPSDLLGAMSGLSADEGYVYVAALLRIYETGGAVPESVRSLSRRTGLSERVVGEALDGLMAAGKLRRLADGRLDSPSTHHELDWQRVRRSEQARAGRASAVQRARPAGDLAPADAPSETASRNEGQKAEPFQRNEATSVERALNQEESRIQNQKAPSLRSGGRPRRDDGHRLPEDWTPSEDEHAYGLALGFTRFDVDGMAEDLRLWARGGGATRQDWAAAFKGWMRRELRERPARGARSPPGRPRQPTGMDHFTALALEADQNLKRRLQS